MLVLSVASARSLRLRKGGDGRHSADTCADRSLQLRNEGPYARSGRSPRPGPCGCGRKGSPRPRGRHAVSRRRQEERSRSRCRSVVGEYGLFLVLRVTARPGQGRAGCACAGLWRPPPAGMQPYRTPQRSRELTAPLPSRAALLADRLARGSRRHVLSAPLRRSRCGVTPAQPGSRSRNGAVCTRFRPLRLAS
jgi:hypothetical protein